MTVALEITADTGKCFLEVSMTSEKIDCSCEETSVMGLARSKCIYQSTDRDSYLFCLGGFDSGYKECRNERTKVGKWKKCIQERDMEKILAHVGGFGAVGGVLGGVTGAGLGAVYGAGAGAIPGWEAGAAAGVIVGGGIGMVYGHFAYDDCTFVSCKPSRNQSDITPIEREAKVYSNGSCRVGG